jgi:hypothetical protein
LYVICFFTLTAFNILSLVSIFVVLMINVMGYFYFGQSIWCSGCFVYLNGHSFL